MLRESIRIAVLVALAVVCASGDTGRIAIAEAGRILALKERPRVGSRDLLARSVAGLPDLAARARRAAIQDPTYDRLLAASELERLAILQELPDDAERAASALVEATRELAAEHADRPGALAAHVDALRALRYLNAQVRAPDAAIDHELSEMTLAMRDRDPENGYSALLLAERAVEAGRFGEARDALLEATRCERVDPELRVRSARVRAALRSFGVADSHVDEILILGGYDVVLLRPGQTLDSVARDLGRRGGERLAEDDAAWVECWAAISAIGVSLAKSAVVLEDAVDALRAETTFLDELAEVAPSVVRRDPGDRRAALESRVRALGLDRSPSSDARAAFPLHEFVGSAIARIDRSNREIERTRRLDDIAAAHAISLSWAVLLFAAFAAARLIERRERKKLAKDAPVGELPLFCRAFAFVVPAAAIVFAAGAGLPPFDRGAGIDRVLLGFAEPNLVLLAAPWVAIVMLLGASCLVSRGRSRAALAAGAGNFASTALSITLVLFAVTARSIDELRTKRAEAVAVLQAERFTEAFFATFGSDRS